MNYANFIQTLKLHTNKPLVFVFELGAIQPNYHITEVLKQQIHATDCGSALNQWNETLIQLLKPRVNEAVDVMPVVVHSSGDTFSNQYATKWLHIGLISALI